jgi:hypothetical protein
MKTCFRNTDGFPDNLMDSNKIMNENSNSFKEILYEAEKDKEAANRRRDQPDIEMDEIEMEEEMNGPVRMFGRTTVIDSSSDRQIN